MDLSKLFEMQRELDERIVKEKGLEGHDLLPQKILALQVELGELANEWRGFKFWSEDREPKKTKTVVCPDCKGMGKHYQPMTWDCRKCYGTGINTKKNPLLEEYVDGLHFFLSIANQREWQDAMYLHEEAIFDLEEKGFDGGLTGAFLEMNYFLLRCYMETGRDEKIEATFGFTKQEYLFRNAWFLYVAIGMVGFGFTPEQIEAAYLAKNKVNHQRQENGY